MAANAATTRMLAGFGSTIASRFSGSGFHVTIVRERNAGRLLQGFEYDSRASFELVELAAQ